MTRIFKKLLFISTLATFCSHAAIIDNETELENSFKDTDTGLVWMDFGVNNNQSYNHVSGQLGAGGEYEGWRLPTVEEVYTMWTNVANLSNIAADSEEPNYNGLGQLYAYDSNTDDVDKDDTVWEQMFSIIGHNSQYNYTHYSLQESIGFFTGTDGLSYVRAEDTTDKLADGWFHTDKVELNDSSNYDTHRTETRYKMSTLLIRTVDVPEPASISMFALALLGLGARRRRLI